MDIWEVLYTTRAMRRLRPDPVPDEVISRILDAGIRAPSGSNAQPWRFVVVTDRSTMAELGGLYQNGLRRLFENVYGTTTPGRDAGGAGERVRSSAQWLADHFHEVPLLIVAYGPAGAASGGSLYPAMWSMCLAARAQGVGSTVTTILGMQADRVNEILGVPADTGYAMVGALPMGYPTGRWGTAARRPIEDVTFAERWGEASRWRAPEPLWPGAEAVRA